MSVQHGKIDKSDTLREPITFPKNHSYQKHTLVLVDATMLPCGHL